MASLDAELSRIRSIFRQSGEADIMPFIEGTAFLLLLLHLEQKSEYTVDWKQAYLGYFDTVTERYQPPQQELTESASAIRSTFVPDDNSQAALLPTPPARLSKEQVGNALHQLYVLCQKHTPATIFNHHLLTDTLDSMLPGGRYPTPRHLVEHMARLVRPFADEHVADLACGSGSMLVAAHVLATSVHATGFDISGSWARLAWVNLALHDVDLSTSHIIPQNALSGESLADEENLYHCLLVNPPFGNKEDKGRVQQALGKTSSATSSEVVFTELAIRRLQPKGRAMVLIPTGVLFRNSTAERELQQRLLDECTLHAVITYPIDAFQPYSALRTHALRFDKTPSANDHAIWLFLVEHDGRTGVKNRTDNNSEPNQLSLVDAALLQEEVATKITDTIGERWAELRYLPVSRTSDHYPGRGIAGYSLLVVANKSILQLHTFRSSTTAQRIYWLTFQRHQEDKQQRIHLLITKTDNDAPVYWQPATTQPTITTWTVTDKTIFDEPYWTVKIKDEGSETNTRLRLLPPSDGTGWKIVSNDNRDTVKAVLTEFSSNLPSALIVNLLGEILAVGALPIDDTVGRALEIDKAIQIHLPGNRSIGFLWPLDWLNPNQSSGEYEARGYLLRFTEFNQLYAVTDGQTLAMLAELRTANSQPFGVLLATLQEGSVTRLSIWQGSGQGWQAPTNRLPRGICFDEDGQVIGLQLPKSALLTPAATVSQPVYDLQPTTYLARDSGTGTLDPPARILGRIKRHQHDLTQRINFLLGVIEQSPSKRAELSQVCESNIQEAWLDSRQLHIWQAIQTYLATNSSDESDASVANDTEAIAEPKTLFTADLLFPDPQSAPDQGTIQRTLDLLVAMGEIVPIYVQNGLFYRRVTHQDLEERSGNGVDDPL